MIKFTVDGRPVPAVRMTQKSKYTSKAAARYLSYKSLVKHTARNTMIQTQAKRMEKPLAVSVDVYYSIPKSFTKRDRDEIINSGYTVKPITRGDIDNIVKSITDACNGVVYDDDIQIVQLSASKNYGKVDCVHVTIEEL